MLLDTSGLLCLHHQADPFHRRMLSVYFKACRETVFLSFALP